MYYGRLNFLNDLSYVVECLACDYTGATKRELSMLMDTLASPECRLRDRDDLLARCTRAREILVDYQRRHEAGNILTTLLRDGWNELLAQSPTLAPPTG